MTEKTTFTTLNQLPQYFHFGQSDHMEKPIEVDVKGEMPTWIKGSLYRNGAGLFKIGPDAWNHLFDGFSVMQRWTFNEGKVTYLASILDSCSYRKCAKHRKLVGAGFSCSFPDPCETIFGQLFNWFFPTPPPPMDNTNVSVIESGDRIFAMTEAPLINEINPESGLVKELIKIADYIAVHLGTAHPHKLKDGTVIYYGTNMNYNKAYNFVEVPPQKDPSKSFMADAKIVATAPSRWKMNISYTHSFGLTENYFVHAEQPLTFNLPRAMFNKQMGISVADFLISHEGESMDIILVSRSTGERLPITYRAPEGVVFHFVNCYEDQGHVVCDLCFFPKGAKVLQRVYLDALLGNLQSKVDNEDRFTRFVLPLSLDRAEEGKNLVSLPDTTATAYLEKGSKNVVCVTPETIDGGFSSDLPCINYEYNARKYRYCYTSTGLNPAARKLVKLDVVEKTFKTYEVDENFTPGEPVFLARPGATSEDDGVIIATIIACNSDVQSYLVVLDSSNFQEIARASLPSDMKMTITFHGVFTKKTF